MRLMDSVLMAVVSMFSLYAHIDGYLIYIKYKVSMMRDAFLEVSKNQNYILCDVIHFYTFMFLELLRNAKCYGFYIQYQSSFVFSLVYSTLLFLVNFFMSCEFQNVLKIVFAMIYPSFICLYWFFFRIFSHSDDFFLKNFAC